MEEREGEPLKAIEGRFWASGDATGEEAEDVSGSSPAVARQTNGSSLTLEALCRKPSSLPGRSLPASSENKFFKIWQKRDAQRYASKQFLFDNTN
jgi:hypothetical protein